MDPYSRLRFGDFEIDRTAFKLLRRGSPLPIEPKALDLLLVLVERAPRVVEKHELFSLVWKDVAVTDNALTRLVAQLRRTLGDDSRAPRYIETITTRGYRFIAEIDARVPAAAEQRTQQVSAGMEPQVWLPEAPARRWWTPAAIAVAAAGVLVTASLPVGLHEMTARVAEPEPDAHDGGPDVEALASLHPEQLTAETGYDGFLAFAPDGRSFAYSSDRSGAFEIYVQGAVEGSTATALTGNGRHNVQPAWSPDGQLIAYHEMAGNGIWIVPSRGGVPRKVSDFGSHPAWSPDGRRLAFHSLAVGDINPIAVPGGISTIWVVDARGDGDPAPITTPGHPAGPHLTPLWSRDPRWIYFVVPTKSKTGVPASLWRKDVVNGQLDQVASHDRLTPEYVLTPDERGIYFVARGTNAIWWLPIPAGAGSDAGRPTGLATAGSRIAQLAVSADGRRIAWTALDSSGHVWATDGGPGHPLGARALTEGGGVRYSLPAAAADGRLSLIGSRPGAFTSIFVLAPGAPLRQLTTHPAHHGVARWMPGEREIAMVTDHGRGPGLWALDADTGRERLLFSFSEMDLPEDLRDSTASLVTNMAVSPDFQRLATSLVRNGTPNIWTADLRDQRPAGPLVQRTFERDGAGYPAWSGDGRWLAYQCNEGPDTHVCVSGAGGGGPTQLTREPGQSWVGGWIDSDTVLFAARRGAVWNVAAVSRLTSHVRLLTRFTEPRGYVRYPRWDAAGRRAVFERAETTGRLWSVVIPDMPGGRPRGTARR